MTVKELIEFLSNYPENIPVSMTQCSCDSPLEDDVDIGNVVFIENFDGERKLVIVP